MTCLLLAIALAVLLLARCTPQQRSHQPSIYQWQGVVDQGVSIE